MIETTYLSEELVVGTSVLKSTFEGIDEIQYLQISPRTSIRKHHHENQWEVWICFSTKSVYVCLKGEDHELINNTDKQMVIIAIKGHHNYSYDDLTLPFHWWGFSLNHGSMVVND